MREAETGGLAAHTFGKLLGGLIRERREVGGFTQLELAEESFPDHADHDGKARRIRELEAGQVANPRATNYTPICETLGIDRSLIHALKARAANAKQQEAVEFQELVDHRGSASNALADIPALSRNELELLATRFEIPAPYNLSDFELRGLLANKADEYQTYRAQIEALDDRITAVASLKTAAQDAASRLDFDAVETLLSRVDAVETEISAETKEARAANALLRGRVKDAFTILSAAADSFASIDPIKPALQRYAYMQRLYFHGLNYGDDAIACAAQMVRDGLTLISLQEHPTHWAKFQNATGTVLQELGNRQGGDTGNALLADAIAAYKNALTVQTHNQHPLDWAIAKGNLASALQDQGTSQDSAAGIEMLDCAIATYREALSVLNQTDHPLFWATTQNNLAVALQEQATRLDGAAANDRLTDAITAYRNALIIRTQSDRPTEWGMTQSNLGAALEMQGVHIGGAKGVALLEQAIATHRDALIVRTRADHPLRWAISQNNLGVALRKLGGLTTDQAGVHLLSDAVAAHENALLIYIQDDHPIAWAESQENLAACELAIAEHSATVDPANHLGAALGHIDAALTVFDPEHTPYDHGTATELRDQIRARLTP